MKPFNKIPKTTWAESGDNFTVEIHAWNLNYSEESERKITPNSENWKWNVYAILSHAYPLFSSDSLYDLHFHGGITYDHVMLDRYTKEEYDWQRRHTFRKVGADYSHLYDDRFATMNPYDGIPLEILRDAQILFDQLEKAGASKPLEIAQ